jgi:cysteine-S-conjugate beta-lyase
MNYNFDQVFDRKNSDSVKWNYFDPDVLPMWVADMDFISPEPVLQALHERVSHGIFGYPHEPSGLSSAIVAWLENRFNWKVDPQALVYLPGVVVGFNLVARALVGPGQSVAYQIPVYMPFLTVGRNAGISDRQSHLCQDANGRYSIDWDSFEASLDETTGMFLFCSPHNPVGRVWDRWELERIADLCLRKDIAICSDEIHADLVYTPNRHIPIASLSAEVARKTVTLLAPSKTFNIPGLGFSFAVIPDVEMRQKVQKARHGVVGESNLLGMIAAEAAYRDGQEWLDQLLDYLRANRDFLTDWIRREIPELRISAPEGTYLAWIDCRGVQNKEFSLVKEFLQKGRVALTDGAAFGPGGEGFIRLNFACPRVTLEEGLLRLRATLRGK